jgi:DNA-directed RNA polymerase subunit RPC12/RpoP
MKNETGKGHMLQEKARELVVHCLTCHKEVTVKLSSFGEGHIANCPSCGKLAYNGD